MPKTIGRIRTLLMVLPLIGICALALSPVAQADTETAKEQYNAGIKEMQEGNKDGAIIAYKAALVADENYVDAYINLGTIYFQDKDYEKALDMFRTATEKAPADAAADTGGFVVIVEIRQAQGVAGLMDDDVGSEPPARVSVALPLPGV